MGRQRHLVEQLLLRQPFELDLLVRICSQLWVLLQLFQHLLVERLREEPVRCFLLHHLRKKYTLPLYMIGELEGGGGGWWVVRWWCVVCGVLNCWCGEWWCGSVGVWREVNRGVVVWSYGVMLEIEFSLGLE